jgi:hypothetical protein
MAQTIQWINLKVSGGQKVIAPLVVQTSVGFISMGL